MICNSLLTVFKINYSAVFKSVSDKAFLHGNIISVGVYPDVREQGKALGKAKVHDASAVVFHRNSVNYGIRLAAFPFALVYFPIGGIVGIPVKMKGCHHLAAVLANVTCATVDAKLHVISVWILALPLVGVSAAFHKFSCLCVYLCRGGNILECCGSYKHSVPLLKIIYVCGIIEEINLSEKTMSDKKYSRVYVEITNICNRSCSFCPGTKREKRRMTVEEFTRVASSLVGVTDYIYLHVMGEPLTHPSLAEFIKIANGMGFKCAITTNGTLLPRVGEGLISSGVYKVNLSVHSFEEGSAEDHISYLEDLCDFADRASSAGVLTVLRLWNNGCDGGLNDRTLDFLSSHLDGEWKWSTRGARIRHKLHLEWGDRFEWPDRDAPFIGESVFCYGLRDHFGILCDGRVVPCCLDREGEITLGNIFETPIKDILSSERAEAILRGFDRRCAVEDLCKRCGYATRFN